MSPNAVIYVNFSQYDNTGRVLDYLREQFQTVLHFSFDHLRLKHGRKTNLITLYQKDKEPEINTLYSLRVPPFFLFFSLPLVGILMLFQTIRHSMRVRSRIGPAVFFTVNAYPAIIGSLLRMLGVVSHVYYWVWDYYPVRGASLPLFIIRTTYLGLDMIALRLSDTLIFPNKRQRSLRLKLHGISGTHPIIPLGSVKPIKHHLRTSHTLGFLGMLKSSQGLDLVLSSFDQIIARNPNLLLEIVGSGPEEQRIREKAKKYGKKVQFLGFVENQNTLNRIARRWFAGLALYEPTIGNESYFGDPSKIKIYLSQGVPIITTNVTQYGRLARDKKFGLTIPYQSDDLVRAITTIHKRQIFFRKRALEFAQSMYYRKLYASMFQRKK